MEQNTLCHPAAAAIQKVFTFGISGDTTAINPAVYA